MNRETLISNATATYENFIEAIEGNHYPYKKKVKIRYSSIIFCNLKSIDGQGNKI